LLTCNGDTLLSLIVWFDHNFAGFSSSTKDFGFFLTVLPLLGWHLHPVRKLMKFFLLTLTVAVFEENSVESLIIAHCKCCANHIALASCSCSVQDVDITSPFLTIHELLDAAYETGSDVTI
jgi:hypothetical protein